MARGKRRRYRNRGRRKALIRREGGIAPMVEVDLETFQEAFRAWVRLTLESSIREDQVMRGVQADDYIFRQGDFSSGKEEP